jgi:hypothetical protein
LTPYARGWSGFGHVFAGVSASRVSGRRARISVVTPADWGQPRLDPAKVDRRGLDVITEANVHHSDSTPPADHADCPAAVRGFDTYHRSEGWAGLGYSRVVCPHGVVFLGRPLTVVPAAAMDHNTPIVAYCLIAKQGAATPPQWQSLLAMAARDAARIGNPLKWTTHREVWPHTDCPGDRIQHQVDAERWNYSTFVPVISSAPTALSSRRATEAADLSAALNRRHHPLTKPARQLVRTLRAAAGKALGRG